MRGMELLNRILPQRLDNEYSGKGLALWLFGFVVVMKSAQSLGIIVGGSSIAKDADGIPVDSYPPSIAQTVLAVLAQGSLWRLFFCVVCVFALVRYRSAIPLMFGLLAANYLASEVTFRFVPLVRVGTPPGPSVNFVLFALMLVGLVLSLWRRGEGGNEKGPRRV